MTPNKAIADPILRATNAVGELFATVGLKAASGKIWAILYLSNSPQSADDLAEALDMSAGGVSMALNELMEVGIVHRGARSCSRRFYYRAETEMWPLVRRIFRERAKNQLARPISTLKESLSAMEALSSGDDNDPRTAQLIQLRHLVDLADFAMVLLDAFMERTRVEIKAAHKWLSMSGKLGGEPLSRLRRRLNQTD
jgi:DNA-binding transcriptional regulator GbsR (MarR family)